MLLSGALAKPYERIDAPHGLYGVGKYDLLVRVPLGFVVATVVNELHLLEDSRLRAGGGNQSAAHGWSSGYAYLARLSRTEQQHLDLVLRHLAVAFELVLDLVIACRGGGGVSGGVGGP